MIAFFFIIIFLVFYFYHNYYCLQMILLCIVWFSFCFFSVGLFGSFLLFCFLFHLLFLFAFLHIISRILKQWVGSVEITLMNEHLVYVSYSFALIWYVILLQTNNFTLALNKTYIQQDSSLQVCWSFTFYLLNF